MITDDDLKAVKEVENLNKNFRKSRKKFINSLKSLIDTIIGAERLGSKTISGYTLSKSKPWWSNKNKYGVIYTIRSSNRELLKVRYIEHDYYHENEILKEIILFDHTNMEYFRSLFDAIKIEYDDSFLEEILKEL